MLITFTQKKDFHVCYIHAYLVWWCLNEYMLSELTGIFNAFGDCFNSVFMHAIQIHDLSFATTMRLGMLTVINNIEYEKVLQKLTKSKDAYTIFFLHMLFNCILKYSSLLFLFVLFLQKSNPSDVITIEISS